jgi:hypothetical protein
LHHCFKRMGWWKGRHWRTPSGKTQNQIVTVRATEKSAGLGGGAIKPALLRLAGPSSSSPAQRPGSSVVRHDEVYDASMEHAGDLTADTLPDRAAKMFRVEAAGPCASGFPHAASEVTEKLVQCAWRAVGDLCHSHGKALSEAFGNFDRHVALGWLLNDVVGLPLIVRADAYAIGLKARTKAIAIEKREVAAKEKLQRALRKLAVGSPERQALADTLLAAAVARLCVPVDLPFPTRERAPPNPSGYRKRAREPAVSAWAQRYEATEEATRRAHKASERAEAAWDVALEKEEKCFRRYMSMGAKFDALPVSECKSNKDYKQLKALVRVAAERQGTS